MAAVVGDDRRVIVTCVHGTWARGQRWPELEDAVGQALVGRRYVGRTLSGPPNQPPTFRYFEWSGRNSLRARMRAAADLCASLEDPSAADAIHLLIAHSYGATVVLHALAEVEPCVREAIGGIVFLSPTLLTSELVDNPHDVATRLLLGAITACPLVFVAWLSFASAVHLEFETAKPLGLLIVALWLLLFRPGKVRARAETLAEQLTLPRLDFPGLLIRAPGDEATAALSSIAAFERVAKFVRSRILDARGFEEVTDRRLREARTWRQQGRALWEAVILVPISLHWGQTLYHAAQGRRWWLATVLFPVTIVCATGALTVAGGAMLLLLLLPAASFLLWPFGIVPTAAAALLTVSVESGPTATWQEVQLPKGSVTGIRWRHSTYRNQDALAALQDHIATGRADLRPRNTRGDFV